MYNDYSGLGAGLFILFLVIYLGVLALAIWVGYLIQRTAVKNGMLRAMQESGMTFAPRPGPPHPGAPQPPHPGAPQPPHPGAPQPPHPGAQPPYPGGPHQGPTPPAAPPAS